MVGLYTTMSGDGDKTMPLETALYHFIRVSRLKGCLACCQGI